MTSSSKNNYQYENYVKVLKEIIGNRSLKEIEEITGINRSTLSRIINGKQTNRPTRSTIRQLSRAATDPNLILALCEATGHADESSSILDEYRLSVTPTEVFYHTIITNLARLAELHHYQYLTPVQARTSSYLEFPLLQAPIAKWMMYYIASFDDPACIPDSIYTLLGRLVCRNLPAPGKVSFVTSDPSTFDTLITLTPGNLTLPCSAILIEFSSASVIREQNLPSAYNRDFSDLPSFSEIQ